ncbi:FAD-dependent oxidoreductase [Cellulosimicrobium funkei]|nr:FAD-dependent oxidoreductase [Cellulosimicrobium funkei]
MDASRYIVIGAGLMGAATAWQLAGAGHEVTVLESATPAHDRGSSHGSARIFRYAYENPEYVRLVQQARVGWSAVETAGGSRLIDDCGAVDHGAHRVPGRLAAVLEAAGVEHELFSQAEAAERWPMLTFETDALWHPGAGVLDSELAVTTMLRLAVADGAELREGWEVARIERSGRGFVVTSTAGESLSAAGVIVCAGGWLPDLLADLPVPSSMRPQLADFSVRQEQVYHFPFREEIARAADWPTVIHLFEEMDVYALPGGRDAGFRGQKVSQFNGGPVIPSAVHQDAQIDPVNRQRMVDYVSRYLPGVEPEPYAESTCLFTSTPSEDFILDSHEGLTLVSACSGHGAKFAPLIGEFAAGLATGTGTVPEIFRVLR